MGLADECCVSAKFWLFSMLANLYAVGGNENDAKASGNWSIN